MAEGHLVVGELEVTNGALSSILCFGFLQLQSLNEHLVSQVLWDTDSEMESMQKFIGKYTLHQLW